MPLLHQCCTGLLSICPCWKNCTKSASTKQTVLTFFLYWCSLQASISHVYPEAVKTWGFFCFCSLAPGQHSELTVKEQLPVFSPPSSFSFCAPLHLQFPSHSHQLIHRLSTARPWSQLLNLWIKRHFGGRASTGFKLKPRIKMKSILISYM